MTDDPLASAPQGTADSAYDADFCAWATAQAKLLRAGQLAEADIAHIAEEIEDLAKRDRRELASRIRRVIEHQMTLDGLPGNRAACGLGGNSQPGARRDRPVAGGQLKPSGSSAGCHRP